VRRRRLTVFRPGVAAPAPTDDEDAVALDDFKGRLRAGRMARVGAYREGRILVHRLESSGRPLPLALALRVLARGPVYIEDTRGRRKAISIGQIAAWSAQIASEPLRIGVLLRRMERRVAELEGAPRPSARPLDLTSPTLYLRTDLSFGIRAGGSVGHIAGVLNELDGFAGAPIFLTTDDVPTVRSDIETHPIVPSEAFWNFKELPTFVLNDAVERTAASALAGRSIGFVYQRYSLNNFAGIRIARAHGVRLVLEYNGSEIWMSRHWGRAIRHEAMAERIERLNLAAADLIVVVSRAMEAELVDRGVDRSKIFVNCNGVDERRYRPDLDGAAIRSRFELDSTTVVGFIGTFGPWHGAEVLVRAFAKMIAGDSAIAKSARLLMIGDGPGLPAVRRLVAERAVSGSVVFTGLVPQDEGPAYLAACDVLISPHVPNPDGTPFFGSPTKLFEYMAMGKGIVASNLDQIGEVLDHGRDAWLVPPGDVDALADAIRRLVCDRRLRERLGERAREQAVARHTWRQHTGRTIDRLRAVAG
jgi:glycosyltransferase involved in cell wall biosynthesis